MHDQKKQACREVVTICMYAAAASGYVGGQCKIWDPQVFDVNITECANNRFIESFAREHRCNWIC